MSVTAESNEAPLPDPSADIGRHQRPLHEPFECDECDGPIIKDAKDDKRCLDCGLLTDKSGVVEDEEDPWAAWREHRDEHYSGFRGGERIKMVGGFLGAWDFAEDDYFD